MNTNTLVLSAFLAFLCSTQLGASNRMPTIPLEITPSWISSDQYNYTTGAALADMDNDGWLDFIVSSGNDMSRQKVAIYYNDGDGPFPTIPNWTSLDIGYHGHLSVGDIDKDGWNDLAVSLYLGPGGFSDEGWIKAYMNDGTGQLERSPSWESSDTFFSFSCSFGDADGDGDLDLAVATGESYYNDPLPNRIYYNNDGVLESLPSWVSTEYDHAYDVVWGDVDNDGDLDLAFTAEESPNKVYINNDGTIETTASWTSTDASVYGNTITWGDVDGDGWLDLAVADNNQLGGSGKFKVYFNDGTGDLETTPGWQSSTSGYGSSVSFMDVDNDGDLDLATGRWWSDAMIFENTGSYLTTNPTWNSTTYSVIEEMVWGDVDRDGLRFQVRERHEGDGVKKVFYLDHKPVHEILTIWRGNTRINPGTYCYDLASGWFSLSEAPASGEMLWVTYKYSTSADLGIANWDPDEGNFLFYHDPVTPAAIGFRTAIPGP